MLIGTSFGLLTFAPGQGSFFDGSYASNYSAFFFMEPCLEIAQGSSITRMGDLVGQISTRTYGASYGFLWGAYRDSSRTY